MSSAFADAHPHRDAEGVVVAALTLAQETFHRYAQLHWSKGTPDGEAKAIANAKLAVEMQSALAAHQAAVSPASQVGRSEATEPNPTAGGWQPTADEIANCRAGIEEARAGLRKVFGDDVPDGLCEIAVNADWLERVCDRFEAFSPLPQPPATNGGE